MAEILRGRTWVACVAGFVVLASSVLLVTTDIDRVEGQSLATPAAMAAIGDSFSTGYASEDPGCGSFNCVDVSWSTGTWIDSHYQRLLPNDAALAGQNVNVAQTGATISSFSGQVAAAFANGAMPEYLTVMLGLGDVCFAATSASDFAARFREGMDAIAASNPSALVLVSSLPDLESIRSAALDRDPSATWSLCGNFFNADDATRAVFMQRAATYDEQLQVQCAAFANCRFDQGAVAAHVWTPDEVSQIDNLHPSVAGQQMLSAVLWRAGFWPSASDCPKCGTGPRYTG